MSGGHNRSLEIQLKYYPRNRVNIKELVVGALDTAIFRRKPLAVVHHSDQGSQYTSIAFAQRCKSAGIRPSMGSRGDCYNNAMYERFNATLECELRVKHRFEAWYNPHRRHSSLGYLSSINDERRAQSAA
jgi:putative transposase